MNKESSKLSLWQQIERLHPYHTLLILLMFGSGIIFLVMTLGFISALDMDENKSGVPAIFYVSTFILIVSSVIIHPVIRQYDKESKEKVKNGLALSLFAGVLFTIFQFFGWFQLISSDLYFAGSGPTVSFVYLISALHVLHLLLGLAYLVFVFLRYSKAEKDPVASLVFFTDPLERLRLFLLRLYWHYLDVIWLIVFIVFILSF